MVTYYQQVHQEKTEVKFESLRIRLNHCHNNNVCFSRQQITLQTNILACVMWKQIWGIQFIRCCYMLLEWWQSPNIAFTGITVDINTFIRIRDTVYAVNSVTSHSMRRVLAGPLGYSLWYSCNKSGIPDASKHYQLIWVRLGNKGVGSVHVFRFVMIHRWI